jgi:muramoyltetrapeptide carboxypeptidase
MILVDPPAWPAHGRLWSHLISDTSLDELHAFAAASGVPRRGFERDHYDVPAEMYDALIAAGARPVSARDLVSALEAAGLRRRKSTAMARRAPGNELLRPPRLNAGDLVAVVATAGVVAEDRLRRGVARLENWGLRVQVAPHVLGRHPTLPYLSADDAERAADFTDAWMDPSVAGIIAARGGYGTQRMLARLDWRRMAEVDPKVLVGFSDVTSLHQAVATRLGLVSVHGHVATSLGGADEASAERLRALLLEPASVTDLLDEQDVSTVVGGVATGVLVGGNLALLAAEVATPSSRPASGGIVLLEDIDEEPYRIDRMLTHLLRSGWFDGVAGIVIGAFTDCRPADVVAAVLEDRLVPLGVPMVSAVDVGHTTTTLPIPLGVSATLDADHGRLTLARPALA